MGKYFCPKCKETIRFYKYSNNGVFVLAHYDGLIRKAIREVKYRGHYAILKEIAQTFPPVGFQIDYLVPVPLSKKRYDDRGFNQAEKLAKYLNLAPILNCLIRTRDTKPQFDLNISQRKENVKNAFALAPNYELPTNSSFCLVDDVCTTGSTLSECAKVLKKAGAIKVYAICVARGN